MKEAVRLALEHTKKRRRDPCIWLIVLSQRDQADHAPD